MFFEIIPRAPAMIAVILIFLFYSFLPSGKIQLFI